MLLKKTLLSVIAMIAIFALAGCGEDLAISEDAVAIVNGQEIKNHEFETALEQSKALYSQQGIDLESADQELVTQVHEQILNEIINQKLLLQDAEKKGYQASQETTKEKLDQITSQFPDEDQLNEALEQNKLTLEDLEEEISQQDIIEQYTASEVGDVDVSEQEIRDFYDQYKQQASEEELPDFQDIEPIIKEQLTMQKKQEQVSEIVERLKSESEIKILLWCDP